jgi:hypothetical protein
LHSAACFAQGTAALGLLFWHFAGFPCLYHFEIAHFSALALED